MSRSPLPTYLTSSFVTGFLVSEKRLVLYDSFVHLVRVFVLALEGKRFHFFLKNFVKVEVGVGVFFLIFIFR